MFWPAKFGLNKPLYTKLKKFKLLLGFQLSAASSQFQLMQIFLENTAVKPFSLVTKLWFMVSAPAKKKTLLY